MTTTDNFNMCRFRGFQHIFEKAEWAGGSLACSTASRTRPCCRTSCRSRAYGESVFDFSIASLVALSSGRYPPDGRGLREIALLSAKLRRLSFNFCLTNEQFADLLSLRGNPLFRSMLDQWFASFQNTKTSTIVNGLEVLTSLAIASADGKLADKAGAVFDIFDFDESGAITLDELNILLKSVVRGLSKLTTGLGPRLAMLCPMPEIAELARQCFQASDLEEEQDLSRDLFVQWVKHTPKIVNLLRCFAQKEFMTDEEAAITIQRAVRGMHGRRRAAEIRLEKQLELEQEIAQAVSDLKCLNDLSRSI